MPSKSRVVPTRTMKAHHYDIVRKDTGSSTWLEDAKDLPSAECRARELVSYWPGQFQILDQRSHQVVATISGLTPRDWMHQQDVSSKSLRLGSLPKNPSETRVCVRKARKHVRCR